MPRICIDDRFVEVPPGGTVLDAARELGLDIPALCFRKGHDPLTTCLLCLVKVKGIDRLVPSCATPAEDGMQIEAETEELRRVRRTGLELLLSDHAGECTAPCRNACPADMDIPLMLRQVADGGLREAITTIKSDIALPAVLGRVCPELCERACRRREVDNPAAICQVKRRAADWDLASDEPYLPPCNPDTGKKVAIVGAGPTGLTAAFHLLQMGHACTLFDKRDEPGGLLRYETPEDQLPRDVLDAEIGIIEKLGATFQMNTEVGDAVTLSELGQRHDAVIVAIGALAEGDAERVVLPAERGRLKADAQTYQTPVPGVFAAGDAVRPGKLVVRSLADGKMVATCVDQFLAGQSVTGTAARFSTRPTRMSGEEIERFASCASSTARATPLGEPADGLTMEQACSEAGRCMQCACGHPEQCKLKHYAEMYGAKATRYRGDRRAFERREQHGDVTYEPGKCILCGLCVQIASQAAEPLGLTFIGRGFDVRVDAPFDGTIDEALQRTARQCAEACPTRALVAKSEGDPAKSTSETAGSDSK